MWGGRRWGVGRNGVGMDVGWPEMWVPIVVGQPIGVGQPIDVGPHR